MLRIPVLRNFWPVLAVVLSATGWAQVTVRMSVDSNGAEANWDSGAASISADGRFVAFASGAYDLVPGDTNGAGDVFVRDRRAGTTERVSVDSAGGETEGGSYQPSISSDGRYVAFTSFATSLVPGDTNGRQDVFVRDRLTGTTERVSVDSAGAQADADPAHHGSYLPSISADGRFVAFASFAPNLVPGDTNARGDIFLHDRRFGTTVRSSVDSTGAQGDNTSDYPSISSDGRFVVFGSLATNLVAGDTNGNFDVFVRDLPSGTTERVSIGTGGIEGNDWSGASDVPTISADGRFVVFMSDASNLVIGDANGTQDVFVHDRQNGTTELVSRTAAGRPGNDRSSSAYLAAAGRYVAFTSAATDLVESDGNGWADVFVRDLQTGRTRRVSVDANGRDADGRSAASGVSPDGRYVPFSSAATDIVPGDTNASFDVFVQDREYAPFASTCSPGIAGVLACPCSNPPSGPDRGCDNSSASGGAVLDAHGAAFVSSDSLVFTTSGETPTALSMLVQGTASLASGASYGQGVRCTSGTLTRLYTKTASGGRITAPDFGAGDLAVTARSADVGNPIRGGQSRWYFVYYRDPVVVGGCPASSTFNATQGGVVAWSP